MFKTKEAENKPDVNLLDGMDDDEKMSELNTLEMSEMDTFDLDDTLYKIEQTATHSEVMYESGQKIIVISNIEKNVTVYCFAFRGIIAGKYACICVEFNGSRPNLLISYALEHKINRFQFSWLLEFGHKDLCT